MWQILENLRLEIGYHSFMSRLLTIIALIGLTLSLGSVPVKAQSGEMPVYIVQPGDTVNLIAVRFGVSPVDLIDTNGLTNPDALNVGTPLKIPGLIGFSGTLTTGTAGIGATLASLSREYQIPMELLVNLNRITSPGEIYIGSTMILPSLEEVTIPIEISPLKPGESVLEKSITGGQNPWEFIETNREAGSWSILPQDPIFVFSETTDTTKFSSSLIQEIEITPLPLVQGKTEIIVVKTSQPATLTGSLNGVNLHFQQMRENEYIALQGVHALAVTGLSGIKLDVTSPGAEPFHLDQAILIESGYYAQDPALIVDESTIDPAITGPEDTLVRELTSPSNPERYWTQMFRIPVDEPSCIKSWYGNRRSYNGSPFDYFHTGIDYGVCANLNIYSPAPGKVVFSGPLTVRGNATIIDHGWGVYSGIWHQSKILVSEGDTIETGQLIGEIGGTGRVTGPHLHWEIWVNGIQVEPLDWMDSFYPEDFLDGL